MLEEVRRCIAKTTLKRWGFAVCITERPHQLEDKELIARPGIFEVDAKHISCAVLDESSLFKLRSKSINRELSDDIAAAFINRAEW